MSMQRSALARVPATVGSFDGALNAAALALNAPLNVKLTARTDGHVGIRYFGENGERVPRDRTNLVVRAVEAALHFRGQEFKGGDFEIYSSVPVGVGLGSSAAAVLAGLVVADRLYGLRLDEQTILDLAQVAEKRIDNILAAWQGGFVSLCQAGSPVAKGRALLPDDLTLYVIVLEGLPRGSMASDSPDARGGEKAQFLAQPWNRPAPSPEGVEAVMSGLTQALNAGMPGLLSVFVCGSGPAVGVLVRGEGEAAARAVQSGVGRSGVPSSVTAFRPTNTGAKDWNASTLDDEILPAQGFREPLYKTARLSV